MLTPGPGHAEEASDGEDPPDALDEPPESGGRPPSKLGIAQAFAALKVGITLGRICTVIHVAAEDRLWVSMGLTHLTAAHSLGRYLAPYGALCVEKMVAGMILAAVTRQGEGGCWRTY